MTSKQTLIAVVLNSVLISEAQARLDVALDGVTVDEALQLALTKAEDTKPSIRSIGRIMFNNMLQFREEIGNREFRSYLLDRIRSEGNESSGPTVYNHAKLDAIEKGYTLDFAKSAGEKIGTKPEIDDELDIKIHAVLDEALEVGRQLAVIEAQVNLYEKARIEQDKAAAKAEKERVREEARAKRKAEEEAAKAEKAKARKEAKEKREAEREDAKKKAADAKAAKKAKAQEIVEKAPEMKWQIENKETGEVVDYAPDRKVGTQIKQSQENPADYKVVKIPA